jgi:hypothetical protein
MTDTRLTPWTQHSQLRIAVNSRTNLISLNKEISLNQGELSLRDRTSHLIGKWSFPNMGHAQCDTIDHG